MKAFWYNQDRKNVCGIKIRELRKEKHISTKKLEIMASLAGYENLTQNAITKIELGIRFVPDYEVAIFAELLNTTPEYLLGFASEKQNN
jgi:transcriptional regulator with XRE-family HTH domain